MISQHKHLVVQQVYIIWVIQYKPVCASCWVICIHTFNFLCYCECLPPCSLSAQWHLCCPCAGQQQGWPHRLEATQQPCMGPGFLCAPGQSEWTCHVNVTHTCNIKCMCITISAQLHASYQLCYCCVQNRELEVDIYWKEGNILCGILYLKLEDFFDTAACTLCLPLEPQGILLAEVCADCNTVCVLCRQWSHHQMFPASYVLQWCIMIVLLPEIGVADSDASWNRCVTVTDKLPNVVN